MRIELYANLENNPTKNDFTTGSNEKTFAAKNSFI
jgi:hypothetical protein